MKQLLKRALLSFSKNERFQKFLEYNVTVSQYLMGIGSGDSTTKSGEEVLIEKLRSLSDKHLCIFDVGANKGQFLRLLLKGLQDTSLHIHAFEPSQYTFKTLSTIYQKNANVTLNNLGLGRDIGESELFYDEYESGLASLSKRKLEHLEIHFKHTEKVQIDKLDNYCKRLGIEEIDLLKLDVEGHELNVFEGGLELFRRQKVHMVSFEFGGCNIDSRTYFQDFWRFFNENGMNQIFRITPAGCLVPIHRYQETHEQFRTTNFLVLREEE